MLVICFLITIYICLSFDGQIMIFSVTSWNVFFNFIYSVFVLQHKNITSANTPKFRSTGACLRMLISWDVLDAFQLQLNCCFCVSVKIFYFGSKKRRKKNWKTNDMSTLNFKINLDHCPREGVEGGGRRRWAEEC